MKKLKAKLKSRAGESLGEVLVALLIAALALTMLASVISASSKLVINSKQDMSQYYAKNDALAQQSSGGRSVDVSVKTKTGSTDEHGNPIMVTVNLVPDNTLAVECFVNDEVSSKPVMSYHVNGYVSD